MTSRGRRLLIGVLVVTASAPVSGAGAVGPPLPSSVSGRGGVVAPGGTERFYALRAGQGTLVRVVRRGGRHVLRQRRIGDRWTVPVATIEGGTTGLSADGRVLALVRPESAFPPTSTLIAVVDARQLVVRRRIPLPGFFTVDAISPDGNWLYLIQYAGQDPLDYRVRAVDARTGRLAAGDIVDPRNPGERMAGFPLARTMSRDGRWVYTLYGGGDEMFIHALDTVGRGAACIDLDTLPTQGDLSGYRLRVSADGSRVDVRRQGSVVATVHPPMVAASVADPAAAGRRRSPAPADGGGFPWWALLPVAGVCVLVARTVARRAH